MAWQKMALLAVAGLLCMSALLNGAEATQSASSSSLLNKTAESVSASNSWKLIVRPVVGLDGSLPVLVVNELGGHIQMLLLICLGWCLFHEVVIVQCSVFYHRSVAAYQLTSRS